MKKIVYIITIVFLSQTILAQQNNTMYFMESLPQTKWLNPASQSECKIHIGGALIPITGQLLFPMQLNYGNNGFALADIIQAKNDKLILPGYKGYDQEKLLGTLRDVNYVTLEFQINWLTFGYKYKDWYFGLDINDKIDTRFSFNKDLVRLGLEGNGNSFLDQTANLGDLGISSTSYSEIAISASKHINKKLTLGLTAKMLFGRANVWTENSIIDLHTSSQENYPITIDADVLIHTSQPIIEVTEMYYDYEADSMVFETKDRDVDYSRSILNTKNLGFGFDLGAIYKINKEIEIQASITDLGYIKWTDNTQAFSVKGSYLWDGYNFQPALDDDSNITDNSDDSTEEEIISIFEPSLNKKSYITFITPKAYLGGTYRFNEKIKTGLLLRSAFFQNTWHPSVTLSGNFRLAKAFETVVSYSMINNSYTNVGVGFAAKAGPFQFFMLTDNLTGIIWPQYSRNFNFRMGINMRFVCNKKAAPTTLIGH